MFGIGAIYTTTDSTIYGAFANTYFNQDRDQLSIFVGAGEIHNDYKDFLGSGISVQTTDQAKAASVEYLHEVRDDLYFGAQAVGGNYTLWLNGIGGIPIFDNQGISASINTVGAGLIVRYDGRDHNRSPTSGAYVTLSNMLFGKSLGSEASFHTYRLDARYYLSHGGFGNSRGHVLALRWNNQWTYNAPVPLYVSVSLRGYKKGQYLAPHMSSFEMEERYRLSARWRATAYLGIAKLYGGLVDSSARSFFPAGGLGMQWVVKEQEGIVIALDYAFGVDGNYGLYLRLGQAF